MTHLPDRPDSVAELLEADRELTPDEQSRVRRIGEAGWMFLKVLLSSKAKASYSVADEDDFTDCAFNHMNSADREEMVASEVFFCPVCSRLLKDRKSPVASSILLERRRVRELWLDVEQSPPELMDAALDRFRRALGLPSS
jgi:hypothetical protein